MPAPAPAPLPALTRGIPIAEVATQAESALITLRGIDADVSSDRVTPVIADELPVLTRETDARLDETARILTSNPSLQTLHSLEGDWTGVAENLDAWKRDLDRRQEALKGQVERLRELQTTWQDTRERAALRHRFEVLPRVDAVLEAITKTSTDVQARQLQVWTLLKGVDEQQARVIEEQASIQQAIDQAFNRLLVRDGPPIWSALLQAGDGRSIAQAGQGSFTAQINGLRAYAWRWKMRFLLHALLAAVLWFILYQVCKRITSWAGDDPGAAGAMRVFEAPLATALVLTLLLSTWVYPQMPRLLWASLGAAALVPTIFILRRITERHLFPILNALVVFYFVDQLRVVAAGTPLLARMLFLVEMLGAGLFLLWFLRKEPVPPIAAGLAGRPQRVIRFAAKIFLGVCGVAFLANALGFIALGDFIGDGTLGSAYLAVILYATLKIADGLVFIALRGRPFVYLGMVRRHAPLIRHRVVWFLQWVAYVMWAVGTLELFSLRAPLFAAVKHGLDAQLSIGSLQFTPGNVLSFCITVWAAFLLSRFVQFVLEEDVYPHFPLPSGLPYAISKMIHYVILLLGFFVALAALGQDMTKFTILAGAFGVGLGFGMQNIVNNFVSGLILLFERPIKVGDLVEIGGTTGVVRRIGIRASIIRTRDSSEIIVPNGNLISNQVTNWTLSNRQRGIEIPVSVASGSDPAKVIRLLEEVAAKHPRIASDPKPEAVFTKFGADAFSFELHAWTNHADEWVQIRSELALAINQALVRENIPIK